MTEDNIIRGLKFGGGNSNAPTGGTTEVLEIYKSADGQQMKVGDECIILDLGKTEIYYKNEFGEIDGERQFAMASSLTAFLLKPYFKMKVCGFVLDKNKQQHALLLPDFYKDISSVYIKVPLNNININFNPNLVVPSISKNL